MIFFTLSQIEQVIRNAYLAGHAQGEKDENDVYWTGKSRPVLESLNDYIEKWESETILVQPPSAPATVPDLPT